MVISNFDDDFPTLNFTSSLYFQLHAYQNYSFSTKIFHLTY